LPLIKSQLFKNSIWLLADVITYPLIMLIATPFFIHQLGASQYGLWMLVNVVMQLINVLNFGVGDSTIKATSHYYAQHDYSLLNRSFNYNLGLSILLMILASVVGLILAWLVHHDLLFTIDNSVKQQAFSAISLCALSAGLKIIEQVFLSVFKGLQRFDIASKLNLTSRVSVLLISVVVVHAGYGLSEIIMTTVAVNILNIVAQIIVVLSYTQIKFSFPSFNQQSNQLFLKNNIWFWLQSMIAIVGFLADRLILGEFADLETIGYYSIATMIGSQIHNVLLSFGSFVFPKVTAYQTVNKSTLDIYYMARFAIAGAGWFIIMLILLFGNSALTWWLGEEVFAHAYPYIRLYLVYIAVILLITVPYHFINGSNYVKLNSLFETVLRSLHLVFMFIAYQYYQTEGLIWALIVVTIINIPFQYYLFHKYVLNLKQIKAAILPVLPAICFVLLILVELWWQKLIIVGIFLLLFWFIYLVKVEPYLHRFINVHDKKD
jgi:O-antigen/teichoic acid export membrane protein